MIHVILLQYKKDSNAQKESYCCTEPSKIAQSLPLKTMKSKKEKSSFLLSTILFFPEKSLFNPE